MKTYVAKGTPIGVEALIVRSVRTIKSVSPGYEVVLVLDTPAQGQFVASGVDLYLNEQDVDALVATLQKFQKQRKPTTVETVYEVVP